MRSPARRTHTLPLLGGLRRLLRAGPILRTGGTTYRRLPRARLLPSAPDPETPYRVRFPDATEMVIHRTPARPFADLGDLEHLDVYRLADPQLTPGMRVLIHRGLTGAPAAWAAERVGPSGAVVSIDPDAESVRFARRRYRLPNVAYERGGIETLAGEVAESFDGIIALWTTTPDPMELAELIRITASGGWLIAATWRPARAPALRDDSDLPDLLRRAWAADPRARPPEPDAPRPIAPVCTLDARPRARAALLRLPPDVIPGTPTDPATGS